MWYLFCSSTPVSLVEKSYVQAGSNIQLYAESKSVTTLLLFVAQASKILLPSASVA